jgi:hypothetical protein
LSAFAMTTIVVLGSWTALSLTRPERVVPPPQIQIVEVEKQVPVPVPVPVPVFTEPAPVAVAPRPRPRPSPRPSPRAAPEPVLIVEPAPVAPAPLAPMVWVQPQDAVTSGDAESRGLILIRARAWMSAFLTTLAEELRREQHPQAQAVQELFRLSRDGQSSSDGR